jgi:GxxExxY protein
MEGAMGDLNRTQNGGPASGLEVGLTGRIIGCAIAVHQELGPGFLESVYQRALAIELRLAGIEFESEQAIPVSYRGQRVATHRLDLIVGGRIIVETKSVDRLDETHVAQVLSYLKATRLRVGLILNFRAVHLRRGIRRVVL